MNYSTGSEIRRRFVLNKVSKLDHLSGFQGSVLLPIECADFFLEHQVSSNFFFDRLETVRGRSLHYLCGYRSGTSYQTVTVLFYFPTSVSYLIFPLACLQMTQNRTCLLQVRASPSIVHVTDGVFPWVPTLARRLGANLYVVPDYVMGVFIRDTPLQVHGI
jgi:hypothetical protein